MIEKDPRSDIHTSYRRPIRRNSSTQSASHFSESFLANVLDRVELAYIESMLEEMAIPYRVLAGDVSSYLSILHGRNFMGTCIYVHSSDLDASREALGSYGAVTPPDDIPPELQNPVPATSSPYHLLIFRLVFLSGF